MEFEELKGVGTCVFFFFKEENSPTVAERQDRLGVFVWLRAFRVTWSQRMCHRNT